MLFCPGSGTIENRTYCDGYGYTIVSEFLENFGTDEPMIHRTYLSIFHSYSDIAKLGCNQINKTFVVLYKKTNQHEAELQKIIIQVPT